jgi:hypothetical protein
LIDRPARHVRERTARRLVTLHPSLDTRYTSLVARVAADVEAALSPVVAANRLLSWSVDPPALRYRAWRDERASFGARLADLAGEDGCLVFADVRECYPSIRPEIVGRALFAIGCAPLHAVAVVGFLRRLACIGIGGLPVGPEASPVLANAVLAFLDRNLAASGIRHLRWVDDVVAAVREPSDAERALATMRAALAPLGLELNEAKTRVVIDRASVAEVTTVSDARRTDGVRSVAEPGVRIEGATTNGAPIRVG